MCARAERQVERRFESHECHDTDCSLKRLEDQIARYIQFSIVGENTEIILLSPFVEKS